MFEVFWVFSFFLNLFCWEFRVLDKVIYGIEVILVRGFWGG